MMSVTIYHNPRCSKSRQTLAILQQHNIQPKIIEYLKNPPDLPTLKQLLSYLRIDARALLRKNERPYLETNLDNTALSEDELISAMHNDPILIERPIVVNGQQAVIGRPPEKVLSILSYE